MKKANSSQALYWACAIVIIAALAYWWGGRHPFVPTPASAPVEQRADKNAAPAAETVTTTAKPAASEETSTNSDGQILYTNNEYGFRLTLPKSWQAFKTIIRDRAAQWPGLDFQLPHDDGSYGTVLTINIFSPDDWKKRQSEGGPIPERLGANAGFVFAYSLPQAFEKFAGYPEEVPGLAYKGPVLEAEDIVIPSFRLK